MKPASDLCFDCHHLMLSIATSGHLSKEEKTERLLKTEAHLNVAKAECDPYNRVITLSKKPR
jgi:hypothetical protein